MGWLNSSIGKKFIMALTGTLLMLFLLVHLIGNIMLYFGPDAFNTYVKILDSIKPLIRVIEIILALIFIYHIYYGIRLWLQNKKANPTKYAVNATRQNTDVSSRSMIITGIFVLLFLIIHLSTFWAKFNFSELKENERFYSFVTTAFKDPLFAAVYFFAMIFLGYHLNHAFQSAFQTFGWNGKKYGAFVKKLGLWYAVIVAAVFASIPLYFFLMGGK